MFLGAQLEVELKHDTVTINMITTHVTVGTLSFGIQV